MIYFHHFHKAAGTSAVKYLSQTYSLPPINANGNPLDRNLHCIEFWDFYGEDLDEYLEGFVGGGSRLLIAEWGVPDLKRVKAHGFKTVTIFREPTERLWSNYCFDVKHRNFNGSLYHYLRNPAIPYSRGDYYSHELTKAMQKFEGATNVNNLDVSRYVYDSFDQIVTLEKGALTNLKNEGVGLDFSEMPRSNRTKKRWLDYLSSRVPKKSLEDEVLLQRACKKDVELYEALAG